MKLDNLKDAEDAAKTLNDVTAIAKALVEAKRDGLAEAVTQISQSNKSGDPILKSLEGALNKRRAFLGSQLTR